MFNIEAIYREMLSTMENNYEGSTVQKFGQAKKQLIEKLTNIIDANEFDLMAELEEKSEV